MVLAPVLALALGCGGSEPSLQRVENPAGEGSAEPNLAAGADGRVYLSWVESAGEEQSLRFATWEGTGWSAPRTVTRGEDGSSNWANYPSLAVLADGTLFAHWLVRVDGHPYASHLQVAVSTDGGSTWSAPVVPHRDSTATEHGFVSMAPVDGDRVALVWLDGREMVGMQEGDPGAVMTLRATTVDRRGRLGEETLLDGRVCDCCGTCLARTAGGGLLALYRDRSAEEIRDISRVRFTGDAWSEPAPVFEDGWKIAGCPVNGPAVASGDRGIAAAWFTDAGDRPRVRVAFSTNGGATFGEAFEIDDGQPLGRVDVVMLPDGKATVAWMEAAGDSAALRLRGVTRHGPVPGKGLVIPASPARSGGFPQLAAAPEGVLVAWTEPGEPSRVRTALLR